VELQRTFGPALLVAGFIVVVAAVLTGAATLTLFVFIPIISGNSVLLILGLLLIVGGFFLLPLMVVDLPGEDEAPSNALPPAAGRTPSSGSSGGFVLIGPIPIVWGSWNARERRVVYGLALILGIILTIIALVIVFVGYRG
jgi:uncharacterized protein (TIGR00304 family)